MGESSAHEVDHGHLDHGFRAVGVGFVVAGETAVMHEPAEGPLDDPASRNHLKAFLGGVEAGDFDIDAQAGAVVDDLGAIAGVGPRLRDAGWPSAMSESRWMPPALSETLATVTSTVRRRPTVSTPM